MISSVVGGVNDNALAVSTVRDTTGGSRLILSSLKLVGDQTYNVYCAVDRIANQLSTS